MAFGFIEETGNEPFLCMCVYSFKCFNKGKTFLMCTALFWGILQDFCTVTVYYKKPVSTTLKWSNNLIESFLSPGFPQPWNSKLNPGRGWLWDGHRLHISVKPQTMMKDVELRSFCANAVTTELLCCYSLFWYYLIAQWWVCVCSGSGCEGVSHESAVGERLCLRIPFVTGWTLSFLALIHYQLLLAQVTVEF